MKKIMFLFIISILYSCGKDPYPNSISDFRPELQTHLKKLASEKELPSKDTIARNFITQNCTKNELLELLKCNKPVLRVIAYRTLVNKKDKDFFKILLGHLTDTAKITWWYYEDAADEFTVSDLLIRKAEEGRKLTRAQKDILIDSVLLKHSYLDVANWMIADIEPNEKYYALIKQKSQIKTDRCGTQIAACYALSKFKKKEDLVFLKNIFSKQGSHCEDLVFKAIEENPDEIYFSVLEKYFENVIKKKKQFSYDELKYYCRAIAKYKNEESLMLFEKLLNKKNYPDPFYFKYNEEYIFTSIHKYKAPIYEDLYNKLKPKMSEYTIEYLDKPDYDDSKTW